MKEKIISALKTKYANLGLGDKAFDGVATFLEKTVTNEEDIENVVTGEDVKSLLKAFQGESDSLRTKNAELTRKVTEYEKQKPSSTQANTPEPPKNPQQDEQYAKLVQRLDALESRNKELETKERNASILDTLKTKLRNSGSNNEAVLKLTLRSIDIKDGDTADSLVDSTKAIYDANFKEFYGDGVVPPASTKHVEGYKAGDFSAEVARLRAEGKLPSKS